MKARIEGQPAFAHIHLELAPGESVVAEADAMASMSAALDMQAHFNGGFLSGCLKKFLGGESLFVNTFTNGTAEPQSLTLVQATPGDIRQVELQGQSICMQPGAYIASSPGVGLSAQWAGFASGIAREGFFKLRASGTGILWYGAYGALVDKEVNGSYIVDTGHLVAYEPQLKLRVQMAGGLMSSLTSGEGLVTRVEGEGRIVMQTRSLGGLAAWLNPKLP